MGKFKAEEAENLEDIEKQFAVKAVMQAETYWGLLEKIPGSKLKLTKYDDRMYYQLLEDFPEFKDPSAAAVIEEAYMKSPSGKAKWRAFCDKFKDIEDYNFGTLLRSKATERYTLKKVLYLLSESNSTL